MPESVLWLLLLVIFGIVLPIAIQLISFTRIDEHERVIVLENDGSGSILGPGLVYKRIDESDLIFAQN